MPAPWKRTYVEVYDPSGYEGRWEMDTADGEILDEAFRDQTLERLHSPGPQYPDSHVEWLDCDSDLVFGFWHHGARPAPQEPKHTRPRPG